MYNSPTATKTAINERATDVKKTAQIEKLSEPVELSQIKDAGLPQLSEPDETTKTLTDSADISLPNSSAADDEPEEVILRLPTELLDYLHDQYLILLCNLPRRRRAQVLFQPFLDTLVKEVLDQDIFSLAVKSNKDLVEGYEVFFEGIYRRRGNLTD